MSLKERVKIVVEFEVDVNHLAEQFAHLGDDAQAQFFCLVAEKLGEGLDKQAWFIGRHLVECSCSTKKGKDFVREIVSSMDHHPPFCESEESHANLRDNNK